MKICYLCADPGISFAKNNGSAMHVRCVVQAFQALGHDVSLLMSSEPPTTDLGLDFLRLTASETVERLFAQTESLRPEARKDRRNRKRMAYAMRHLLCNVAVEKALGTVFDRDRPDLVYERYSPFSVAGSLAASTAGIPHVLEVNAPLAWEGREHRNQAMSDAAQELERVAFESTGAILTVSRELSDILAADGLDPGKIHTVMNGVDLDLFKPDGATCAKPGEFVIGFVGSLKAWHGINVLADAFRLIADDRRVHLMIVGDGPEMETATNLADEFPGRVTLTGAVEPAQVPAYLRAMDVAVAPYPPQDRFYFSPLKVLEYMAAGCAVIASDIGQVTDMFDDGETGMLVPAGDAAVLAETIRRLINDPEKTRRLSRQAADQARRQHGWQARARDIIDIAELVLKNKKESTELRQESGNSR